MPFELGRYLAESGGEEAYGLTKPQAKATLVAYHKQKYHARITKDINGYMVWKSQNLGDFYRRVIIGKFTRR